MNRRIHSKASVFLLELMINILFFSVLMCVSLKFFVTARTTTNKTVAVEEAINWCQNLASIYQSGDGTLECYEYYYPDAIILEDEMIIQLDDNYQVTSGNSSYQIVANISDTEGNGLKQIKLRFIDSYGENVFGIKANHYSAIHPQNVKGGGTNE